MAQPAQPRWTLARCGEVARRPNPPSQDRLRRDTARSLTYISVPARPAKTVVARSGEAAPMAQPAQPRLTLARCCEARRPSPPSQDSLRRGEAAQAAQPASTNFELCNETASGKNGMLGSRPPRFEFACACTAMHSIIFEEVAFQPESVQFTQDGGWQRLRGAIRMRDSAAPRGSGPSRFEPDTRLYCHVNTQVGVMRSCKVAWTAQPAQPRPSPAGRGQPSPPCQDGRWRDVARSPGGPARPAKTIFGEARRGRLSVPALPAKTVVGEKWRGCPDGPARPAKIDSGEVPGGPARPAKTVIGEARRGRLSGPALPAKTVVGEKWRGRSDGPAHLAKTDSGEELQGGPAAQPAQPRLSSAMHGEVALGVPTRCAGFAFGEAARSSSVSQPAQPRPLSARHGARGEEDLHGGTKSSPELFSMIFAHALAPSPEAQACSPPPIAFPPCPCRMTAIPTTLPPHDLPLRLRLPFT